MTIQSVTLGQEPHQPGDPDIPEERNPRGHDAQPGATGSKGPVAAPLTTQPRSNVPPPRPEGDASREERVNDAKFLVDEFGIAPRKAADLVADADPAEISSINVEVSRRENDDDPLASVPTPQEPDRDLVPDNDEERLKPVLHHPNNRRGGG